MQNSGDGPVSIYDRHLPLFCLKDNRPSPILFSAECEYNNPQKCGKGLIVKSH